MKRVVLDASIALKWFLKEEDTDIAEVLLERIKRKEIEVDVPQLFFFELANVIKTKTKSTSQDVLEAINKIFSLKLSGEKINKKLLVKANFYAQKYDLTIYDASYLALAKTLGVNLITADEKLKKRARLKFVKSLGDLKFKQKKK